MIKMRKNIINIIINILVEINIKINVNIITFNIVSIIKISITITKYYFTILYYNFILQ